LEGTRGEKDETYTNKNYLIAFGVLAIMSGWATSGLAATAEERAKCEEMAKEMGTEQRHAHSQDKGQGRGPMNLTHAQCKKILAEPVEGSAQGNSKHDHE
jgi:hypothetical protein